MTNIIFKILLIILLLIILGWTYPYLSENKGDIGNYLAVYCVYIAGAFLRKKHFKFTYIDKPFLKNLPLYIKFNKDIYDKLIKEGFTYIDLNLLSGKCGYWVINNNKREKFWLIMKPLIKEIIDETLKKSGLYEEVLYPVIHFRCSDVPFIKVIDYKLQKYTFYKDSLEKIKSKSKSGINYDTVILLTSPTHKSNNKNREACKLYTQSLKRYIESIGYKVIIQSKSADQDFATLFYAPVVISPGSSFSFMSGFFSDGIFISEGHRSLCTDCDEWLVRGYSIDHKNVKSYHDTDNVISLLNEPATHNSQPT
jgi:hypothetical protein